MHAGKCSGVFDIAIQLGRLCPHVNAARLLNDAEEFAVSKCVTRVKVHPSMCVVSVETSVSFKVLIPHADR